MKRQYLEKGEALYVVPTPSQKPGDKGKPKPSSPLYENFSA